MTKPIAEPRSADDSGLSRRSFLAITVAAAGASLAGVRPIITARGSGDDVTGLSLHEAAEQVRRRRISPVDLAQACLARIERLNPTLDAFITVTAESALASARDAEAEIRLGRWRGPLHGIPIALKDLFDTAGVRTTAASALYRDRVPAEDAEVVRRLKAAGAVILGKNNMHEFAYGGTSAVSHFGAVHNPWNLDHIAGGSSGGSAAAVAAQLCFGALGSDTAASIRQPAAFCGIVGLKPTYGLVSTRGVIPLSWTFDHVGPLTRNVTDAAIILRTIAGYDPLDVASRDIKIPDYVASLRSKFAPLRVGVAREFFFADLDPDIEAATSEALIVLQKLTGDLHDVTLPAGGAEELRAAVRASEAYTYHADSIQRSPEDYQPETLLRLRSGKDVTARAYVEGRRDVDLARRTAARVFENVDVIVTPTTAVPPALLTEAARDVTTSMAISLRTIRNTSPFNVYGWPTISVPCGLTRSGLPIGLQISGAPTDESVVLRVAHAYEQITDWHTRRPPTA